MDPETGYWYKFITDSAVSWYYLYRIPVWINYGLGDWAWSVSYLYSILVWISYVTDPDPTCTVNNYEVITGTDSVYRYKLITGSAGTGSYLYMIPVRINNGFGQIQILPVQDFGTNKLRTGPNPDPTCTVYRYKIITDTDSVRSGSYLYRIPV